VRSANWVAPICPQGLFLVFFKGWGTSFPIKFPKSSHQIPLVPINNPSKSFKLPTNSHRNPLIPINNSSNSFCSHQVLIKILSIPQVPINFTLFPWTAFCSQPTLHKPTLSSKLCERLGQSAKRSTAVPGQARRAATVAGRRLSRTAEQKVGIFCLPGVVEDSGQICFSRGSQPRFIPSYACAKNKYGFSSSSTPSWLFTSVR
jgi:hypothetical protein